MSTIYVLRAFGGVLILNVAPPNIPATTVIARGRDGQAVAFGRDNQVVAKARDGNVVARGH